MNRETDEALMERVKGGDSSAFDELYVRHASRAMRVASSLTRDPELAAEGVQDGFLAIWRGSTRYNATAGAFRSWAMTVVHNRTIDLLRRRAARAALDAPLDDVVLATLADGGPGPAERAAERIEARTVRQGLDELPRSQRDAVVLAFFGGLTHSEIASHLGLPLGTVKGRMRMALQKLSGALEAEVVEAG